MPRIRRTTHGARAWRRARESSCFSEPAAQLRGFAKAGSPSSSRSSLMRANSFFGRYTSPRISIRAGASSPSVIRIERIVRIFSVRSSPVVPSPRVIGTGERPFSYSSEITTPSTFGFGREWVLLAPEQFYRTRRATNPASSSSGITYCRGSASGRGASPERMPPVAHRPHAGSANRVNRTPGVSPR